MHYIISSPTYVNRRTRIAINGTGEFRHSIPGIDCPKCSPWAGGRILTITCPVEFEKHPNLISREPIDVGAHLELRTRVKAVLGDVIKTPLLPGDSFQPFDLVLEDQLLGDFFWPRIGVTLVSQRVKDLILSFGVNNVSFFPPRPSIPMAQPVFQLVFDREIGAEARSGSLVRCPVCGREEFDQDTLPLQRPLSDSVQLGWLSGTYLHVVSEGLKNALTNLGATNIIFQEIPLK